jgi:hypothetical protein
MKYIITKKYKYIQKLNPNMIYKFINNYKNSVVNFTKFIIKISWLYLMWILLHYAASQLYIKFCVPYSLMGFIVSPFLTSTPHCQGLRWVIFNGGGVINNMWIVMGTWICANLLLLNNNTPVLNNELKLEDNTERELDSEPEPETE